MDYSSRLRDLEKSIFDYDLDKPLLASKYHELAVLLIKEEGHGGENFEKAGNILENYWAMVHLKSNKSLSQNKKIILMAIKNYRLASKYYASKGLKLSESRVNARIVDLEFQLKSYGKLTKQIVSFLVIIIFFSSVALFSSSITGFSVASIEQDRSIFLGGFLLILGFIGAIYILFLGYLFFNEEDILSHVYNV